MSDGVKVPLGLDRKEIAKLTLPQVLRMQAERIGKKGVALREKAYGIWQPYTWHDYAEYVKNTALGLIAVGLRRGDRIGIITNNHVEWLFSELGGQAAGAVTLNLFTTAVAEELVHSLNRVSATYVIVQDQEQADKIIDSREKLSHVRRVIYIDPTGMRPYRSDPWLLSFRELLEIGRAYDSENGGRFVEEVNKGRSKEVAVMIQTSGTTGIPKIAMLTHRNFTAIAEKWLESEPLPVGARWISITPPAWIVDQMWGVGVALLGGLTMNFPETPETVAEDFREIGPDVIITSSRFWEDLASKIRVKMADAGRIKRMFFTAASRIGGEVVEMETRRKPIPSYLRFLNRLASVMVFRPLLDRVGCSMFKSAFTGGHPISPEVIGFFRAAGLNLKQCYGLTEAGGIFQVQPDGEVRLETVGKPLPGVEVRLSEEQEVLVRSESNFAGYYDDYRSTSESFLDGWLRTGDAGYIDADGHLLIIGRKEEIIRNKEGEAFSPDFIETRLKFSPYIKEAVVFGEGRPFITALLNIDMGNVGNWAEERMIPYTTYSDLSQQEAVQELIRAEVEKVNRQLPDFMKVKKFILLYKLLDADDDELTRTGKVRRRFVYGLYIKLIEAMYGKDREVDVKSRIRYRDGQVGSIDARIRIIEM
ncbi:MAG: AMP-binding protein [Syntrophobacterales bacterium]|mgnify:CR=1 FL=1|nr:AMP-binding protein [Syntrophobacterales bacterium]HRT27695.1 AMP-binding protein [Syntrophales bacterium]